MGGTSADLAKRLELNVERRIETMHDFCKEMQESQFDLQEVFQKSKACAETTAQRLEALTQTCNNKKLGDAANFDAVAKHLDGLETKLDDAKGSLQEHSDNFTHLSGELERLTTSTRQLVTPEQMQGQVSKLRSCMDELDLRAQKSEDSITEIIFDATSEKRILENLIKKVEEKADKNRSDILHLEEAKQIHSNSIQAVGQRATHLEKNQTQLRERADAMDKEVDSFNERERETTEMLV